MQWELPFVLQNSKTPEQTANAPPKAVWLGEAQLWAVTAKHLQTHFTVSDDEAAASVMDSMWPYVICSTQPELTWKGFVLTTVAAHGTDGESPSLEPSTHPTEGLCCKFWKFGKCMFQFTSIHALGESKSPSISTNLPSNKAEISKLLVQYLPWTQQKRPYLRFFSSPK